MSTKQFSVQQIELSSGTHSYVDIGDSHHSLLMLHGFSLRPGLYPLAYRLMKDFRVVIPDMPFSTRNGFNNPHTLDDYSRFLVELVDRLNLQNVSIFGNSVGGSLGLVCCINKPDFFEKLIVRCPVWTRAQLPAYMQNKPLIELQRMLSGNRFLASTMLRIFYRRSARISPVEHEKNDNHYPLFPYQPEQINPVVFSRFLGYLTQVEITERLPDLSNETLILWGENDTFISSEWGDRLNGLLPNSNIQVSSGEFHNLATIDNDALSNQIMEFID